MRNSEKLLPEKKDCYSHLYMKDVTDADYTQITKRIFKDFKVKKKGGYNDLFVQNNTWLLVDVFEMFRNMCFEIDDLESASKWLLMGWRIFLNLMKPL